VDVTTERSQQALGQRQDQQDRSDVQEQDVLDHVHQQQLRAELVDRGEQREEDHQRAAREQGQAPEPGRVRLTGATGATPQALIPPGQRHHPEHDAWVERPRCVRSHVRGILPIDKRRARV
jgi:hypothetical protein